MPLGTLQWYKLSHSIQRQSSSVRQVAVLVISSLDRKDHLMIWRKCERDPYVEEELKSAGHLVRQLFA